MTQTSKKTQKTSSPSTSKPKVGSKKQTKKYSYYDTPFGNYFQQLAEIDKDWKENDEYGSFLILGLVEEVGEMARAYLAKHGRKPTNLAAQQDETYEQELGDILLVILRFARIKHINLDERIQDSLSKVLKRRTQPKTK